MLSAWRGWRPLAADPHAEPGGPVSRDHIISENKKSNIMFVAGGKWTTWREMAQDAVDKLTDVKCTTRDVGLIGAEGYHKNLPVRLVQRYAIGIETAKHLSKAYGGKAYDVCNLNQPALISTGFPYIEAEVIYACRVEYAQTVEDIVTRRTRIAYLNKDAALSSIDKIADIMQSELDWSEEEKACQIAAATDYVQDGFGGPDPVKEGAKLRSATFRDVIEIFNAIDVDKSGSLTKDEVGKAADLLGFSLTEQQLFDAFRKMDSDGNGRVDLKEFEEWWNDDDESEMSKQFHDNIKLRVESVDDIRSLGSGTFLG